MRCYADQQAGQQPAQQQRSAYPKHAAQDNQSRRLHDYQAQQPVSRRTQSQAYAHLMPALVDRVSKDSVDANRRQDHCQQRKATMSNMMSRRCAIASETRWSMVWMSKIGCSLSTAVTAWRRASDKRRGIVRSAQSNVEVYIGELSHGDKEFRLHFLFQSTVPHVVRDAYNRYPLEWIRTSLASLQRANRLPSASPAKKRLAKARLTMATRGRCLVVFSGERTPFENRCAALRGSSPASH